MGSPTVTSAHIRHVLLDLAQLGSRLSLGGDFRMFLGPQLGGFQLFAETAALRALLTVRFSAPNFECDRVQLKRI